MAQEQVEEYLETIYDLESRDGSAKTTAIAKCLEVAPASVTEVLRSLSDKGLVAYEPYKGATLTEEGKKIADTIKRKHRLLEVFLNRCPQTEPGKSPRGSVQNGTHNFRRHGERTLPDAGRTGTLPARQPDQPLQQRCGELC